MSQINESSHLVNRNESYINFSVYDECCEKLLCCEGEKRTGVLMASVSSTVLSGFGFMALPNCSPGESTVAPGIAIGFSLTSLLMSAGCIFCFSRWKKQDLESKYRDVEHLKSNSFCYVSGICWNMINIIFSCTMIGVSSYCFSQAQKIGPI